MYGQPVEEGSFKHVVALSSIRHHCTKPFCTGAIITDKHVLTAGHCVHQLSKQEIVVVAGIRDWNDNLFAEFRYVREIHQHPGYRPGKPNASIATKCVLAACQCFLGPPRWRLFSNNDIAVLELERSFPMNQDIHQISLPMLYDRPREGARCLFAGWGVSESTDTDQEDDRDYLLRWSTYNIMISTECEQIKKGRLRETEFCARHPNRSSWTTEGDSGGVLVCDNGAVGVLQAGGKSGEHPSSYFMISHYMDFIDIVLESLI